MLFPLNASLKLETNKAKLAPSFTRKCPDGASARGGAQAGKKFLELPAEGDYAINSKIWSTKNADRHEELESNITISKYH